jgi:hypothetical protein
VGVEEKEKVDPVKCICWRTEVFDSNFDVLFDKILLASSPR